MEKYAVEVDTGHAVKFDLKKLIVSRLLIVANSGGGKSHAVRKLAEVTHGHVQQIIIDTEGEFASLRAEFDYVYAAAVGGDALAHPKTAKLLAERLLETGVSAIIDIYELKRPERHAFVRLFFDAMVNAPKNLWHPVLVILDEAHVYAPEKDESEAMGAVTDLATLGRKRGFCLVAATQRLAKLSKDVAAELNNKMVGRMLLDVDVKRAAGDLGMSTADAMKQLRALEAGDFFAYGPALSMDIRKIHTGEVKTRHHKSGDKYVPPPKPTEAILAVLPKLADLPKESEEKAKTEADLRKELAEVRRELTLAKKGEAGHKAINAAWPPQKEVLQAEYARGFTAGDTAGRRAVLEKVKSGLAAMEKSWTAAVQKHIAEQIKEAAQGVRTIAGMEAASHSVIVSKTEMRKYGLSPDDPHAVRAMARATLDSDPPRKMEGGNILSAPQQRILDSLAWLRAKQIDTPSKNAVAAVSGASPISSAFANNLGALRSAGLIEYPQPGLVALTRAGLENSQPPADDKDVFDCWLDIVTAPQRKILEALKFTHPTPYTKESLAETTQASITSSAFANNLGALRTLGAIDYPKPGYVALTKHSMPE